MYVTKTQVAARRRQRPRRSTPRTSAKGVHMVTNCGVGAYASQCDLYPALSALTPPCSKATRLNSEGEMPIRKALAPVEFAGDLKQSAREDRSDAHS